jgi:RNA polymerase sigma factor
MSAFNEAIDKFDTKKPGIFLLFAQTSIERRIIDYLRKSAGTGNTLLHTLRETMKYNLKRKYFLSDSNIQFEDIESKDEIDAFMRKLEEFGISFEDLWLNTPKHKDSRKLCFKLLLLWLKMTIYTIHLINARQFQEMI